MANNITNKLGLLQRINITLVAIGAVSLLLVNVFVAYMLNEFKGASTEQNVVTDLKAIVALVDAQYKYNGESNILFLNTIDRYLELRGGIVQIDSTCNFVGRKLPAWKLGTHIMQGDTNFPETLSKASEGRELTIFQKAPDGYIRICTSIKNADGSYALGTMIDNNSAVAKTVDRGEIFYDKTNILGKPYIATYKPLYINGKVAGMLFTGSEENKVLMPNREFGAAKILGNGFALWIDTDNNCIMRPNEQWKNLPNDVWQQISGNRNGEAGKANFKKDDKMYEMIYIFDDNLHNYISFVYPESDKLQGVGKILWPMSIAISIIILIILFVINIITKGVIRKIGGEPDKVREIVGNIAKGDFRQEKTPATPPASSAPAPTSPKTSATPSKALLLVPTTSPVLAAKSPTQRNYSRKTPTNRRRRQTKSCSRCRSSSKKFPTTPTTPARRRALHTRLPMMSRTSRRRRTTALWRCATFRRRYR